MSCTQCGIVRVFRAFHCPFCKTCVPKHSRHSIVWGSCIGASNQLLAMGFFLILSLVLGDAIYGFYLKGSYGIITKVMFYLLNGSLCWISTNEFLQLFIFVIVDLVRTLYMERLSRNLKPGLCSSIFKRYLQDSSLTMSIKVSLPI